jgi:hypothetical protein
MRRPAPAPGPGKQARNRQGRLSTPKCVVPSLLPGIYAVRRTSPEAPPTCALSRLSPRMANALKHRRRLFAAASDARLSVEGPDVARRNLTKRRDFLRNRRFVPMRLHGTVTKTTRWPMARKLLSATSRPPSNQLRRQG